jgi:hypothetical protein
VGRRTGIWALLIAVAAVGCGSGQTFTAQQFIDAANQHNAGIGLGQPLDSSRPGVDVWALTFRASDAAPGGPPVVDVNAAGSLLVTPSGDDALAEYSRCQVGSGLVCYRVANVVLVFEGAVPPEDLVRLTSAVKAMASG